MHSWRPRGHQQQRKKHRRRHHRRWHRRRPRRLLPSERSGRGVRVATRMRVAGARAAARAAARQRRTSKIRRWRCSPGASANAPRASGAAWGSSSGSGSGGSGGSGGRQLTLTLTLTLTPVNFFPLSTAHNVRTSSQFVSKKTSRFRTERSICVRAWLECVESEAPHEGPQANGRCQGRVTRKPTFAACAA